MVNLALKGYCLPKIGQLVNKTHSTAQGIVNKFKYTGSITNEPRRPKRRILIDREERCVLDKIRKNPRLSARNC